MNPNETPPSFSSGAIRTIAPDIVDDGTIPDAVNNQGPSFTKLYPDQEKPINEPLSGDSYGYDEEKAPSYGVIRPFIPSNPSGGDTYPYSDNQPPSFNDVNTRDTSQTGSSYTGNNERSVPKPGMSLTGRNFTKFHPGAGSPFPKDDY